MDRTQILCDKFLSLLQDYDLESEREKLFTDFTEYASINADIKYFPVSTPHNQEILYSIKANDYATVWDIIQLLLCEKDLSLYCQIYQKLLKKFPQIKFNIHNLYFIPLDVFKESYHIFFDTISNEDFESYIDGYLSYNSFDVLYFLLNQKTDYQLIKIIYKLMYYESDANLKKFIEWTESSNCIRDVEIQYVKPFDHHLFYLHFFNNFINNYYAYPQYYTNFKVLEEDICWFYEQRTLENFLELYEYGYVIVSREKIMDDFLCYAYINCYEDFEKIIGTYHKKGFDFDFFNPAHEEKFVNLLISDGNKIYFSHKIDFFEQYYRQSFEFTAIDNFNLQGKLSISTINFFVKKIFQPDLTNVFVAYIDSLNKFCSFSNSNDSVVLSFLIILLKNNKILIDLNYIFNTYIDFNKNILNSNQKQYLSNLIDNFNDKINIDNKTSVD
jgi:hypothetical protein